MANQIDNKNTSGGVENVAAVCAILHPLLALFYTHLGDVIIKETHK